ncbi:M23 family metallopeptidase [Nostoc sp. FACHB-152]|uniref:LysM peptidoglycan-binding domain-containing M23 family metallopeptidase n=1 Tax=unclassified Nostoc TaxID=2593658 RepID=UPI0016879259|nr:MULTISPECIES: M23 family metallopeptidase [unclassified Nostoc]MBD2446637.1 M23 family metallopeptidase [Nostoc sp. FACHB-152]MBD2466485.1 M23 family metallopeptidase [Nostoc sp. FACHB-145]
MTFFYRLFLLSSLITTVGLAATLPNTVPAHAQAASCPAPALSRFQRHKVMRGETLESIAQQYNLAPETLIVMNPNVNNGRVKVGSELQIPPYNGIVVEVPSGQSWRQVAAQYKVRPDAMFEINGCQTKPKIVFVPGLNWLPNRPQTTSVIPKNSNTQSRVNISGYPLQEAATVGLGYGWQINPQDGKVFFHSGVDLLSPVGSPVQAIAPGNVVLAQDQGSYGNLVIINHAGGMQSRYAHLGSIKVKVGQQVNAGDVLGTVGTTGQPTAKEPHLHFEVRSSSSQGWVAQDPKGYLKR